MSHDLQELLHNKWTPKRWNGPHQFEDPTGDLMMLPSDMALLSDPKFRKWVEIYAQDEARFTKVDPLALLLCVSLSLCLSLSLPLSLSFFLYSLIPSNPLHCLPPCQDFTSSFSKLIALGVPVSSGKYSGLLALGALAAAGMARK